MNDIEILKGLEKLLIVGKIQFKLYDGEVLNDEELKILASTPYDEILLGSQLVASNRLKNQNEENFNNLRANVMKLNFFRNTENKKLRKRKTK